MPGWKNHMQTKARETAKALRASEIDTETFRAGGRELKGWKLCDFVRGKGDSWTTHEFAVLGNDGVVYELYYLRVDVRIDTEDRKPAEWCRPLGEGVCPEEYFKQAIKAMNELKTLL